MRLSPLDIQNHTFATRLRGLDPSEVEAFLQAVSDDFEGLLRERDELSRRVHELEERVEELGSQEGALKDTLLTAQNLTEDLKQTAMRESEVRIAEAEVQAERIIQASHRRAARLAEDIRELKALRARLAAALKTTVETHLSLIESLGEPDSAELEESKIAYLRTQAAPGEG